MLSRLYIGDTWTLARKTQPQKLSNYKWIQLFEKALAAIDGVKYNTSVGYYEQNTIKPLNIQYSESSPVVYYFKMSPASFYIDKFDTDIWKHTDIDTDVKNKFINASKYTQPTLTFNFNQPYILFALQSINFTSSTMPKKLLVQLVHWAEINKVFILFKLHPFTKKEDKLLMYWEMLKTAGVIKKYAVLVDYCYNTTQLINNSKAVWTYFSGVGLEAVLSDKPCVYFSKLNEYHPVVTTTDNIDNAYKAVKADIDTVNRFLSWYYYKLIIDVSRKDLQKQIETRIDKCIKYNYAVEDIFK